MSTQEIPQDGPALAAGAASGVTRGGAALDQLLDVDMPVVIEFGRTSMTLEDLLALAPGSVVELERAIGDPVDIYVSDRRLAQGEVVVIGDHFGVRVTRVLTEASAG